jgi:acyl carrier protein
MAAALDEAARRRLQESGIETMDPEAALEGLERALASGKPQVGVLALDWTRYRAARSVGSVFLSHIDDASPGAAKPRAPGLLELLEEAPAERKFTVLLQHVRANALSVLGVPSGHPLDNDQGLRDAGLDSLMALELKNRLQQSVNQPLPATLAFDFPTIAALAGFLADEVLKLRTSEPAAPAAAPSAAAPVDDLDALSDEEAAALLTEELSAIRQRPTRRGAANG